MNDTLRLDTEASRDRLVALFEAEWRHAARDWDGKDGASSSPCVAELLTRAACERAGIPLEEHEVQRRTADLASSSWLSRARTTWWLATLVAVHRSQPCAPVGSVLDLLATRRDTRGTLLSGRAAARELRAALAPTLAIANELVQVSRALQQDAETMLPFTGSTREATRLIDCIAALTKPRTRASRPPVSTKRPVRRRATTTEFTMAA